MIHLRKDYDRFQDPSGIVPAHEPVFIIRGQDKTAPAVIRMWAQLAREHGASRILCERVEGFAGYVYDWQKKHGNKVPDTSPANLRELRELPIIPNPPQPLGHIPADEETCWCGYKHDPNDFCTECGCLCGESICPACAEDHEDACRNNDDE